MLLFSGYYLWPEIPKVLVFKTSKKHDMYTRQQWKPQVQSTVEKSDSNSSRKIRIRELLSVRKKQVQFVGGIVSFSSSDLPEAATPPHIQRAPRLFRYNGTLSSPPL